MREVARRGAVRGPHLDDDVVLLALALEAGDLAAAQHGLDRVADGLDVDAHQRRLLAVDLDVELGLVELEVGVEVDEPRVLARGGQELVHALLQHVVGLGGLEDELDRLVDRALAERGRVGREGEQARDAGDHGRQLAHDLLLLDRPLVPVDQPGEADRPGDVAAEADDEEDALDQRALRGEGVLDPLGVVVGVVDRAALGREAEGDDRPRSSIGESSEGRALNSA